MGYMGCMYMCIIVYLQVFSCEKLRGFLGPTLCTANGEDLI